MTVRFGMQACITVASLIFFPENGTGQKINLSVHQQPLKLVLREMGQQSGVNFIYSSETIDDKVPVTITLANTSLDSAIRSVLGERCPLYIREGAYVVFVAGAKRSGQVLRGVVIDSRGNPVPFATVRHENHPMFVRTDDSGRFHFESAGAGKLTFSSVGYQSRTILVERELDLEVVLETMSDTLDDAVVKGYYTTTRRLNTGNVSTVSGDITDHTIRSNFLESVQGRVPGLRITQHTGIPGGGYGFQIRGRNSLSGNSNALIIINGIPCTNESLTSKLTSGTLFPNGISWLNLINASDIERIDVLKDGDATALYGSRGCNGVILITTKQARTPGLRIGLRLNSGISWVPRKIEVLGKEEYIAMRRQALVNDGLVAEPGRDVDITGWAGNDETDWQQKLIGKAARLHQSDLGISFTDNTTQLNASLGSEKQNTVMPGENEYQKRSLYTNISRTWKRFRWSAFVIAVSDNSDMMNRDLTAEAITLPPNAPAPFRRNGEIEWGPPNWVNPFSFIRQRYKATAGHLLIGTRMDFRINRSFNLALNAGTQGLVSRSVAVFPESSVHPELRRYVESDAVFSFARQRLNAFEPRVEYTFRSQRIRIEALAGVAVQHHRLSAHSQYGFGFPQESLMHTPLLASKLETTEHSNLRYHYLSAYMRSQIVFNNKFAVNMTMRRDGSSNIAPASRFAQFGSAAVAWKVFESGTENSETISLVKFRSGIGVTGNDHLNIPGYHDDRSRSPGSASGSPVRQEGVHTRKYRWGKTTKAEAAVELGLFRNKVLVAASYYYNKSRQYLLGKNGSLITGFASVSNALPARFSNSGLEIGCEVNAKVIRNLSWSTSINITIPSSKLNSFPGLAESEFSRILEVGQPLGARTFYELRDIDPQTGRYRFADNDGNGIIDEKDKIKSIDLDPLMYGAIDNMFVSERWRFAILLVFAHQYTRSVASLFDEQPGAPLQNHPAYVAIGNSGSTIRQQSSNSEESRQSYKKFIESDQSITNASFVRIKDVSVAYTIRGKENSVPEMSLELMGRNLFTWTRYNGFDPETTSNKGLPPLRSLAIGIRMDL
jgi:TonB-linked SusC/RagA family outer membrane protein